MAGRGALITATVIDASLVMAWCFRDEVGSEFAASVLARLAHVDIIVPHIFWYEVRNVLVRSERSDRIQPAQSDRFLERLSLFRLHFDYDHDETHVVHLVRLHTLSFYDAAYLETAMRHGAQLATLDGRLAAAAESEGVLNPAK